MIQTLCFYIGLMRLFRCVKPAYEFVNAVCANPRSPSAAAFEFGNPQKPSRLVACVRLFLVLNVARSRNVAEIEKRIVARVAVNMVNIASRPFVCHVKPSQPTRFVPFVVNPNDCVPFWFNIPRNRPWNDFAARFDAPSKATRFGSVVQYCSQLVRCDVVRRHAPIVS